MRKFLKFLVVGRRNDQPRWFAYLECRPVHHTNKRLDFMLSGYTLLYADVPTGQMGRPDSKREQLAVGAASKSLYMCSYDQRQVHQGNRPLAAMDID